MFKRLKSFTAPLDKSFISAALEVLLKPLKEFSNKLTLPQKLYFVAFMMLLASLPLMWVGMIAVVAMAIEFWPIFERMWHSLAGKAVLLLFYAIIANFALANASSVVNEVIGVSASHFNYTHNLAILLYIPAWCVVMSAIALMLMQFIYPIYVVILWLLKPLGIQFQRLTKNEHYHKLTYWVRALLAWIVVYHLLMLISISMPQVGDELEQSNGVNLQIESSISDPQLTDLEQMFAGDVVQDHDTIQTNDITQTNDTTQEQHEETESTNPDSEREGDSVSEKENTSPDAEREPNQIRLIDIDSAVEGDEMDYQLISSQYYQSVRKAIAWFAFYLEADQYSRCEKAPGSRVMVLNDYEVLEITPNADADYGYEFAVKKCISPAFPTSYYQ